MLKEIHDALKTLDENVYYGGVDGTDNKTPRLWNYIVYLRQNTRRTGGNTGYTDYVTVAVIREEYIPEGTIERVIAAMEALPGVRLSSNDIEYTYTRKPGTGVIVEMAELVFSFPRKRGAS